MCRTDWMLTGGYTAQMERPLLGCVDGEGWRGLSNHPIHAVQRTMRKLVAPPKRGVGCYEHIISSCSRSHRPSQMLDDASLKPCACKSIWIRAGTSYVVN